jgi:hypothetical protein
MISPLFPPTCEGMTIATDALQPDRESTRREESASGNGRPLPLAELVEQEAQHYRARGTFEGAFLARQMERLAQLIRWTGATTPEDHEARMEVWDEEIREQWFDRGYHEGYEAGRRDALRALRPEGS